MNRHYFSCNTLEQFGVMFQIKDINYHTVKETAVFLCRETEIILREIQNHFTFPIGSVRTDQGVSFLQYVMVKQKLTVI